MPSIWRKSAGSWVKLKTVYRKTGGSWQSVKRVWRKSGGTWRLVFLQSLTPDIAQQVTISMTTGSTQLKTLVGRLYRWSDATSVTYQFTRSTNGISFSNITGASGTSTNPAVGSSNTNDTYTLAQADVIANTTNYYRYISKGINSTFGTEQTSASDYITLEAPRDLTLSSSKTSTSITISWTNDTYSGRYEYQTKLTSSSTWNSSVFLAPSVTTTSFTLSSLPNSTAYDFRVRGWTGTSNNYGYFGNWATTSVTTNAPAAPNAPTGVTASGITKNNFDLSWTSPTTGDAATGFDFGASTSSTSAPATQVTSGTATTSGQWRTITIADRPNNFELISGLSPATDYYGWVRSRNSGGTSAWVASAKVTTTALKPPNNITGLAKDTSIDSQTSLKFTWTQPTTTTTNAVPTSYVYSYGTTDAQPTNNGDYETTGGATGTDVTLTGLTANTDYYIFIKAKNDDGLSSTWVRGTGKTKAASNPPGVPSNVSAGNPSQSGFRFTWAAPTTGGTVTSYLVALSTGTTEPTTENEFDYVDDYYSVGTALNYTFPLLDSNKLYYCWVKARNADGTSTSVRRSTTTAVAPTISAPSWAAATNFQRVSSTIRWGWNNAAISPTTGTYTTIVRDGYFWEFYAANGTSLLNSGFKSNTTVNDTRVTVNGTTFRYLLYSAGTSPDIAFSTNSRFVRVQQSAYDYDSKLWYSPWTAQI
jgi:hypothetical protein